MKSTTSRMRVTTNTSSTYQSKAKQNPANVKTTTTISTRTPTNSTKTRRKTDRIKGKTQNVEERTRTSSTIRLHLRKRLNH
jgi:hypothetical protein